jgi:hypothetical protein
MNAVVSRRIFVSSVASGLPLLAGVASGAMPPAPQHDHEHPLTEGLDLTFDHIVKEVAAVFNRGEARGFTGEDARAVAAQLRAAAVRSTELRLDRPVKNAVSDLIRRRGRDAVLQTPVDPADVAAQLQRYGIKADRRRVATPALDPAARKRVIDSLLGSGITGVFVQAAGTFENIAAALDIEGGGARRVQYDPTTRFIFCAQIAMQIAIIEAQAAAVCMLAGTYWDPALQSLCATLQVSVMVQYAMYLTFCP